MKPSWTIALALTTFLLGFISGIGFISLKGPAPGMEAPGEASLQLTPPKKPAGQDRLEKIRGELAELEKKIKESPGDVNGYVQAGHLLLHNEIYDQALTFLEKAIEIGGENPHILTDAGICRRRLGQPKKAIEYFRRARKADPAHEESAVELGIVYFHDLQDPKAALAAWREYLSLDPKGERADMIRRVSAQIERQLEGK